MFGRQGESTMIDGAILGVIGGVMFAILMGLYAGIEQ